MWVVAVERVLGADLVQGVGRDHPRMAAGNRPPRLVDSTVGVPRRRAAAAVAGVVLLLAREPDEHALVGVDPPVALGKVRVAVLGLGKDSFELRVELRAP